MKKKTAEAKKSFPRVAAVMACAEDGSASQLKSGHLVKEGLREDCRADGCVYIMDAVLRAWLDKHSKKAACASVLRENLTVERLNEISPAVGMRLRAGGSELTVIGTRSECPEDCPRHRRRRCPARAGMTEVEVTERGEVYPGDPVLKIDHIL